VANTTVMSNEPTTNRERMVASFSIPNDFV
jgi:hypothetical protein